MKDKERPGRSSKFEHQQLQAHMNEDACHFQKQLAIRLNIQCSNVHCTCNGHGFKGRT